MAAARGQCHSSMLSFWSLVLVVLKIVTHWTVSFAFEHPYGSNLLKYILCVCNIARDIDLTCLVTCFLYLFFFTIHLIQFFVSLEVFMSAILVSMVYFEYRGWSKIAMHQIISVLDTQYKLPSGDSNVQAQWLFFLITT